MFPQPPGSPAVVMMGTAAIVTLLWLVFSGFFGYASARRSDSVAAIPFPIALQMRFAWQFNLGNVPGLPTLEAMLSPLQYGGDVVTALVGVGILSRVFMRCHLGLGAGIAMLIVTVPVAYSAFPIHDFAQVVPHTKLIECNRTDCAKALVEGGYFYYVRSATCYFHPDGPAAACADADACLSPPCAAFEARTRPEPVEVRTLDIWDTFSESRSSYPQRVEVGLFRVYPKGPGSS